MFLFFVFAVVIVVLVVLVVILVVLLVVFLVVVLFVVLVVLFLFFLVFFLLLPSCCFSFYCSYFRCLFFLTRHGRLSSLGAWGVLVLGRTRFGRKLQFGSRFFLAAPKATNLVLLAMDGSWQGTGWQQQSSWQGTEWQQQSSSSWQGTEWQWQKQSSWQGTESSSGPKGTESSLHFYCSI